MLLSFAQFEREVTGERIRDKIAASKQKGIWMGGVVPLGYRVSDRALHIVEEHASLIRTIFAGYLERGAVSAQQRHMIDAGLCVPERIDGAGRSTGGKPFSRGHLYAILSNPIYVGRLAHKGRVHEGQHPAIVDPATWDAVQAKLASNHHQHRSEQASSESLLLGRIRDDEGNAMTPSHARKGPRRYRYYVSQAVLQGRDTGAITRVPAPEIEALVIGALRSTTPALQQGENDAELIAAHLRTVTVHADRLELERMGDGEDGRRREVLWSPGSAQRRREVILPPGTTSKLRPMKVEDRSRILHAIAIARTWLNDLIAARVDSTDAIALRQGCSERSVRMTLSLASLSPEIVRAIIEGRLPRGIGIKHLAELPASWSAQHASLGF